MVEEKMVSTSFGGVADYEEQAPGASVTYARTLGAGAARLERTWRLGLGKSSIGYGSPNATWCWVSPSARWRKGSTSVRFPLLIVIIILLLIIKIFKIIHQDPLSLRPDVGPKTMGSPSNPSVRCPTLSGRGLARPKRPPSPRGARVLHMGGSCLAHPKHP